MSKSARIATPNESVIVHIICVCHRKRRGVSGINYHIYAYKIVTDRRIGAVVLIGSIRLTNVRDTFVIVGANFKSDTRLDIYFS